MALAFPKSLITVAVATILFSPGAGLAAWNKDERDMAGYSARDFVEALRTGELEKVLELSIQPFNFNGRELSGNDLRREWEKFFSRNRAARAAFLRAQIEIMDYAKVIKNFGFPPEKFKKVSTPSSLFAVVRLPERTGFMLILKRSPSHKWLIAGVAE